MKNNNENKKHYEDGVVLVGSSKPFVNYINASNMQLQRNEVIILKARGKAIINAINLSEVLKKQYGTKTEEIKIDSENFKTDEGKEVRVSSIELIIRKGGN